MGKIKLSDENYRKLLASERELHDVLPEIDNAEQIGIDVAEYRKVHGEAMERIARLKQFYAPKSV